MSEEGNRLHCASHKPNWAPFIFSLVQGCSSGRLLRHGIAMALVLFSLVLTSLQSQLNMK